MSYKNGKIYTIKSNLTDKIYIGSTASPLTTRFSLHKSNNKQFIAGTDKKYCSSFEILNFGDSYIELLEHYPCENKNQLVKREGQLIRTNECVNKYIAGRTRAEWRQDNKQKIQQYEIEYRIDNKQKINEKFVCECGGNYTSKHKAHHLKTLIHSKFVEICAPK